MNKLDDVIKMLDASKEKDDENSDREILKILDDCESAVKMVEVQIRKLDTYKKKFSKYKWGYSALVYTEVVIKELKSAIGDSLDAIDKARSTYK